MSIVFPRREAEAHAFLDANPDITSIHVIWTDICGVARGKILRRDELVPAWKDGRFMPISALVLDITGQDVPETGLVFDEGDRDMLMWPIPGTFVRVPWLEKTAQYTAAIHDLDGTPRRVTMDGAARVRKLVLLGTPNLGSVSSLHAFLTGERVGLARIAPRTLATLPSGYQLFPHPLASWLVGIDGQPMPDELFDAATWQQRRQRLQELGGPPDH